MIKVFSLTITSLFWIQRHRVRIIDADTAINGLIVFACVVTFVMVFKWLTRGYRQRY